MALTAAELVRVRQLVAQAATKRGVSVHWLKAQINAALNAVDARWDAPGTQTALSNDIEAAAPGVFSVAEKRFLLAFWLITRGNREEAAL